MSRVRLGYALAFCGILITTGGCSGSATAPEAATARGADISAKRDKTPADSVVTPSSDGDVSATGGVILVGGGRSEP